MGPGEIILSPSSPREKIFDVDARIFNFDIDVAGPLKSEHVRFLREQVLPAVQANPGATIILVGSASRSGSEAHNLGLSRRRAEEVQKILAPVNSQILDSFGRGAPTSGPIEEKHDRAVFMFIAFPTDFDVELRTDDWRRAVNWDDIVGFGGLPPAPLNRLNIQVTLTGVPRSLSTGVAAPAAVAPQEFNFDGAGIRGSRYSPRHSWKIPLAPPLEQPANPVQTFYRLSDTVGGMGFPAFAGDKGYAAVNREGVPIDFSVNAPHWSDRESSQQGLASSASQGRVDAKRLMRAGGVEAVTIRGVAFKKTFDIGCFVRSPATAFFYSGNSGAGSNASCLSRAGECWMSPDDLVADWRGQNALDVLILAAPRVLAMNFAGGVAVGGPGGNWAKLLTGRGGPLTAILGYDDDAPSVDVIKDIASQMGDRLAGGVSGAQYVDAWLDINVDHDGKNTWNAVGMDRRGYFWIGTERATIVDKRWWGMHSDKPVIVGPAPIP